MSFRKGDFQKHIGFSPRALISKTIRVHGDTVTSAITSNQSRDVRDAFAKGIYGRLFIHIVKVGSIL